MKKYSILIAVLIVLSLSLGSLAAQNGYDLFQKALAKERGEGNLEEAIALYKKVVEEAKDKSLAAKAQLRIGICYEKLGQKKSELAQQAFQKVIDSYPGQTEIVKVAREKLKVLLKSQAVIEKGDKEFKLRKVWAGGESPWYGKISPDGRYFSFVDEGENAGDLAILELATDNIRRLTNMGDESENYEYAFFSRWSPDGKQIVYEYEGDFSELRVVGLDGSGPRILYRDEEGGYVRPHDWSPDGKQVLAFLGREGTNQIVLISVEDGSMRVLKTITHGEHPYHWSFSPDGRYIVYDSPQAEDSPEPDIFLFSVDDKHEVPIVEHLANDKVLGWAPDSDWLLFISNRTGSWDAWAISVAEGKPKGNPELIKKGIGNIYPMGFTQNGTFYYTDSKQMNDIYSVTMNLETGKIDSPPNTIPILDLGGNHNPQYSPDGKYLAYTRNSSLCILSLETSKVRKFPLKFNARYLRWSPDRQYILFNSIDVNRRKGIYRLEVQTGNIIPISLPKKEYNIDYGYSIHFNEWSPDGKSFFYVEYDRKNKLCKILNRDFETGNEKELYQGPKYFSISLSPDGQWLAFTCKEVEGEIKVMPASGGEPRELCKRVQQTGSAPPLVWTADGRYVLFSTVQADSWISNLWRVPIEGGKPQKLGLEMAGIYSMTVNPNGRQIAFLSAGPSLKESEIWVMENFLLEEKKGSKGGQK